MKVFGYARTSTDRQEHGLEKQKRYIRDYCEENGYELVEIVEKHISGRKDIIDPMPREGDVGAMVLNSNSRPGLKSILNEAKFGEVDKLVVYDHSRLARKALNTLLYMDLLEKNGVEVEAVNSKQSKMELMMNVMIDEIEVDKTIERTKKSLEQKREDNEWTGRPPTGYEIDSESGKLVEADYHDDLTAAIIEYEGSEDVGYKSAAESVDNDEVTPSRVRSVVKRSDEKWEKIRRCLKDI